MDEYTCILKHEYCVLKDMLPDDIISNYLKSNSNEDNKIGNETLEDVCECHENNCLYRTIAGKKFTKRQLEQLRCVGDYKYITCEEERIYMTMDEAILRWVDEGYAKVFADKYNERLDNKKPINHWDLFVEVQKDIRNRKI